MLLKHVAPEEGYISWKQGGILTIILGTKFGSLAMPSSEVKGLGYGSLQYVPRQNSWRVRHRITLIRTNQQGVFQHMNITITRRFLIVIYSFSKKEKTSCIRLWRKGPF